ncbi:sulfatase family protein [Solirubrobacter soli]|uniref:sulfatase family protein n=1 Tax=Solirubrobacter soli TaxID=363832 RepID=UPI000564739A|nr:sulfatase [Solirubrobacter soli]
MTLRPNIVYLHSHDTGRHIQPYGHQVPTPNIQRLADQGLLFRQAFSAAPVCSGSRAALLTGEYSHTNGMLGLAHRGYRLADYDHHLVHTLRAAGYRSTLIGEQHVAADPVDIGYDEIVELRSNQASEVAPAAARAIRNADGPYFLSVGFFETHRDFFEPTSVRDALYSLPPANLPDTPVTRRDMAAYKASARALDQGVGTVLDAIEDENTLVIFTTDHGLAFPGAKATLTDRGIGVLLIIRGPGGFTGGKVSDELVSQVDIFPTICELLGIERPAWLRGKSLLSEVNDAVFAEITFHAAYEPQRAVRTKRYKYIRRYERPVLANIDDSPSKDYLLAHGLAERDAPEEALYDLVFDPNEANNIVDDEPEIADELRQKLQTWMVETGDPLLDGPIAPAPGTEYNTADQRSPDEPTTRA